MTARDSRASTPNVPTQEELRTRLSSLQYHVTQEKGTERAFTGRYSAHTAPGTYYCVCCGTDLFESEKKFDAGGIEGERDAYIEAGMQAYEHGLRRRLLWLVYIIPMVVVLATVYAVNYQ